MQLPLGAFITFHIQSNSVRNHPRLPSLLFDVSSHSVFALGSSGFKARGKMFEVKSNSGKLLFSADEHEVVVGAERLRVMGECTAETLQTQTHC